MQIVVATKEEFEQEIIKAQLEFVAAIEKYYSTSITIKQRRRGYASVGLMNGWKIKPINGEEGMKLTLEIPFVSMEMAEAMSLYWKPEKTIFEGRNKEIFNSFK